nr:MAG TPA: hypothetical protein [Caudoviricetes sp.]
MLLRDTNILSYVFFKILSFGNVDFKLKSESIDADLSIDFID